MTIHLPQNTSLPEIRRVMELIQKGVSAATVSTVGRSGALYGGVGTSGGSSSAVGPQGPTGATGPAGADGSPANLLVGANTQVEILVGPNGDVLTDNMGLALMGVNVTSAVLSGSDNVNIGVLNAT